MKFDDVLVKVGEFGRYQIFIYLLVFVISIPVAFHGISIVFLAGGADHWCAVSEWVAVNCSEWDLSPSQCTEAKRSASIPLDNPNKTGGEYSQCTMYNVTGRPFVPEMPVAPYGNASTVTMVTRGENTSDVGPALGDIDYHSPDVVPCTAGWEHDTSQYRSTINMDFQLVCARKDLSDISSSFWFVGVLIGSLLVGLADKFGRCTMMWISLAGQLVFGVATAFAPTFWWFVALRMILAMFNTGVFILIFILGTEFVGPSKRVLAGTGFMIAFSIGYMGLSVIAYLVRNWRYLQLALSIPIALFFVCVPIIPESARWLLTRGELSKANVIIRKVAKVNGVPLQDPAFTESDTLELEKQQGSKSHSVLDLFRTPNLRMETLNLLFNWTVESLVYYGISLSSSDFGVNVYVAAFVSGAVEIPAYVSSIYSLKYLGRRLSLCLYLIVAGVACLILIFIPLGVGAAVVAMIGKFGITGSFSIVYIYTAELYPTPLRSVGVGICSMSSRIGGILAPFIRISGRSWRPLPSLIYGLSSIIAGLLALLLPETRGLKLPETVEEGENLRNLSRAAKYAHVPINDANGNDDVPIDVCLATASDEQYDLKV